MTNLVVVVDTQYDFMMPDGALYVPGAEKLIVPMIQYLAENRDHERIDTMDTHFAESYWDSEESKSFPLHCVYGRKGWASVLPNVGATWLKTVFDPWADNARAGLVADLYAGCDVEIIGVAADYCVKYAYEGFKSRGFNVRVIPELTVGIKENPYALGINRAV